MKQSTFLKATFAITLALRAHAYLDVEEGAFDVRHIHMVERGVSGEIGEYDPCLSIHLPKFTHPWFLLNPVGRAFANTYETLGTSFIPTPLAQDLSLHKQRPEAVGANAKPSAPVAHLEAAH